MVTKAGGTSIPVQVDHLKPAQVQALAGRVDKEHNGRLDILIDDIWGGELLFEWDPPSGNMISITGYS